MNIALGNLVKNIPSTFFLIEDVEGGGGDQLDGDFCQKEGKRKGKPMFFFFQQSEKKNNREQKSVLEEFSNRTIKLVFFLLLFAKA